MLLPPTRRTDLLRVRQAIACFAALLFLLVSLSAEAKKKKPAKKGKAPASKVKGSDRGLPPPDEAPESDEATSDEKPAPKKKPVDESAAGEDEEKASKPKPSTSENEVSPEDLPPKKKPPKEKPPKEAETEGAGGLVALQFGVGGKALFRNLTWTDSMNMVAPYSLTPGPEATVWLETYPAAFATDGFAGNIGLYGSFNYGFGASSKTMAGATLTTKYQDFLAGLKIRIPLGSFIPYLAGGYGMQKFHLEPPAPERPNVNYSLVHAGAGARIQVTPELDIDVSGGAVIILTAGQGDGEVADGALYPKTTGFGIDAALSIGYRITSMIGVRVGGDLRRIGLDTHRKSTDPVPPLPTGGALDQYISAWGGVEVVFDGMGGGAGHAEEEAPAKKPAKAKKPPPQDVEPEAAPDKGDSKGEDDL